MHKTHYRTIWIRAFGKIPKDEHGRSYEIHHINGNHKDDRLENLECIPAQLHFERHLELGDPFGAMLIARRLGKSPKELSDIQRGAKRSLETCKKISEAKKAQFAAGLTASFKGKKHTEETRAKMSTSRRGKRHSSKLSQEQVLEIRSILESRPNVPMSKRKSTYERALAKHLQATKFQHLSMLCILNILTGKSWSL